MLQSVLHTALRLAVPLIIVCQSVRGDELPDFASMIRPLLAAHCFECHGPDTTFRRADLRVDLDQFDGGLGLADIVNRSDLNSSPILKRILSSDPQRRMPPPGGMPLMASQIDLIQQWVAGGARTQGHWAFAAPVRPSIPSVSDTAWPQTPIDNFILKSLEERGVSPSPRAADSTLLRRVALDILGLPPTLEQQRKFAAGQSWRDVTEQLLTSPHHGERMAQNWLDLARYADTTGHAADRPRTMWLYRDWVIDAFNRNQPFDQFTVEQLAGDMLPNASDRQRVATGFHRNSIQALGNNPRKEEFRVKGIVDRLDTTGRTWLALTIGCAECHDHKYDPVTQREYYELFAVFNNVPHDGERFDVHGPRIEVLPEITRAQIRVLRQRIEKLNATSSSTVVSDDEVAAWLRDPQMFATRQECVVALQATQHGVTASSRGEPLKLRDIEFRIGPGPLSHTRCLKFDGQTAVSVPNDQIPSLKKSFSIGMWVRTNQAVADLIGQYDWKSGKRSFVFGIGGQSDPQSRPGKLSLWISETPNPFRGAVAYGSVPVNDGRWHHVAVVVDAGQSVQLYVDGRHDKQATVTGSVPQLIATPELPLAIGAGFDNSSQPTAFRYHGELADIRLVDRLLTPRQLGFLTAEERSTLSGDTRGSVNAALKIINDLKKSLPASRDRIAQLQRQVSELQQQRVTAQVMAEMTEPRATYIHVRGDFENRGARVMPGIPRIVDVTGAAVPNRLIFAKSLVHPSNPLTARVIVNRIWAHYFGSGLVPTTDDFGIRGELPTHPQLLDWLALELIESRWNLRHIERLIVNSATYQQSSTLRPALTETDPHNRLLARMSRIRLAAEQVRDQALAAAGVLNATIGGPSVYPPQPDGVGEFRDATAGSWKNSRGDSHYRRSMYTFWQRMSPYPAMVIFDAPSRERCTAQRSRTNTPLQALVTLNDPHFADIARRLASRVCAHEKTVTGRIQFAFRCVVAREPSPRELELFQKAIKNDQEEERVAWFRLAQVLLNLDETLTRE